MNLYSTKTRSGARFAAWGVEEKEESEEKNVPRKTTRIDTATEKDWRLLNISVSEMKVDSG